MNEIFYRINLDVKRQVYLLCVKESCKSCKTHPDYLMCVVILKRRQTLKAMWKSVQMT